MERRDTEIERDPATGQVHEHRVVSEDPGVPPSQAEVVSTFNPGWRAVQLVYLAFGVIDGLLVIRLVLKLLGANPHAAFASWIYAVTNVFLAPFKNLLPPIATEQPLLGLSVGVPTRANALLQWPIVRF